MVDLLPTVLFLCLVAWFLQWNDHRPVVQLYVAIVVSYLNVFPALHFLLSSGYGMEAFAQYQAYIIVFFELPLLLFLTRWRCRIEPSANRHYAPSAELRLSCWLPLMLGGLLAVFWFVALAYDLFFVRLGYEANQYGPVAPSVLLYPYRAVLETSFFVILFLFYALRATDRRTRYRALYKTLLLAYLATFLPFFIINSRMQFLVLALCVICTQFRPDIFSIRKMKFVRLAVAAIVLVVGLTLLREFYIEDNQRLEASDLLQLLQSVGLLIAGRLDSVQMLNALATSDFDPFGFQLSGLLHVLNFNIAFFTDPQLYAEIRASEVTSPSVEIINRLLSLSEVDFPKSMILDMFLSFGVYGLVVTAALLARVVTAIQRRTLDFRGFTPAFLVCIYTLPLLFQFEKEFLGFLVSFVKWLPVLVLVVLLRPRRRGSVTERGVGGSPSGVAPQASNSDRPLATPGLLLSASQYNNKRS